MTTGDPYGWVDREAYPFRSRWLDRPAGRLHYVDQGTGEPVVLVHGTPDWSYLWRHLIRALVAGPPGRRCLAMDHIGFGLSDKPPGWSYGLPDHAANLAALLDPLDLRGVTMVVHDLGVPIGLSWALDHPERVTRLIVLNGVLWSLAADPATRRILRIMASPLGRFLYLRLNVSARVIMPRAFGDRARLSPAAHAQYLAPFPRARDRHGPWGIARSLLEARDWLDALWARRAALDGRPVLLVWGLADPAFGSAQLDRWRGAWPGRSGRGAPGLRGTLAMR